MFEQAFELVTIILDSFLHFFYSSCNFFNCVCHFFFQGFHLVFHFALCFILSHISTGPWFVLLWRPLMIYLVCFYLLQLTSFSSSFNFFYHVHELFHCIHLALFISHSPKRFFPAVLSVSPGSGHFFLFAGISNLQQHY